MTSTLLTAWIHHAQPDEVTNGPAWIPPDGCQDLIGMEKPDGTTTWHVFTLAQHAQTVWLPPGVRVRGYRLRPGSQIDENTLIALTRQLAFDADTEVQTALSLSSHVEPRALEALQTLAHAPSVTAAAKSLGVSPRTLERLTIRTTRQTPNFWRGLARVRQAACSLRTDHPLADIAADHGYADQAHLNLAFRRWLRCTPGQLRASPDRLALLQDTGHG